MLIEEKAYTDAERPENLDPIARNSIPSEHIELAMSEKGTHTGERPDAPADMADKLFEQNQDINHLSFRAVEPVNVEVRNLSITVDVRPSVSSLSTLMSLLKGAKETRTILDDINAVMPAGELMAIIGGSGSGKVSHTADLPFVSIRINYINFLCLDFYA